MEKIKLKFILFSSFFVFGCVQKGIQVKNSHTNTTYESIGPAEKVNFENQTQIEGPGTPPYSESQVIPPTSPSPSQLNRTLPKFGFIFSGGGAKTWAHIGVLKEMQKLKWPVHAVAGFEWGAVVAATYAENLSPNEVEWEMAKLKEFDKTDRFLKAAFEKKSTTDLKVPFVCPSLNIGKQAYYLLNRGMLQQLIPFCVSQPPLTPAYSQSVAVMTDVGGLAQHLRSTGANRIILINVLSQSNLRSFVSDYTSAENILWVQSAALMAKKPAGVDEVININLDDYGIKDLDKRRDLIAKGSELSYDQLKKLAQKYGL